MISKSELQEWKAHPVTEVFFNALLEMEQAVTEQLIGNVGESNQTDDWYRGYIFALRDTLRVDLLEEE